MIFKKLTKLSYAIMAVFMVQCTVPTTTSDSETATDNATTTETTTETTSTETTTSTGDPDLEAKEAYRVAFYNVENLFDTVDDPKTADEEFTPNGKLKWDEERYQAKLGKLAEVIAAMELPDFVGICEIENKKVLEDLAAQDALKAANYGVAHKESHDHRGIDVALLYKQNHFKVDNITATRINIPESITNQRSYKTRDMFHVEGHLANGEVLNVFVNHWPSRRGGLAASSPKREYVAEQLRKRIDEVWNADKSAKIIIMGDFNDETNNKSIAEILGAQSEDTDAPNELINAMAQLDADEKGTYNFRGTWNMLDQIILSDNFFGDDSNLKYNSTTIFKEDFMLYKGSPNRTYGGPNYYGGYSDHLPVYVDIAR